MSGSASIYSLATEERVRAESAAWARFSNARDRNEFCASWLTILCAQIERVTCAVVLLGPDEEGAFVPAAVWPNPAQDLSHLGETAQRTLTERRGLVCGVNGAEIPARDQPAQIGYPIDVAGTLRGAVVLDVPPSSDAALQRALRHVHWGIAWLVDRFRQQLLADQELRSGRLAQAMQLVATSLQEQRLPAAALAVVNDLAGRFNCDRVSIGFEKGGNIKVEAISHTAVFDARTRLVRLIGDAMDEVLDLEAALVWPPTADDELGAIAHGELASELGAVAVCSVPLQDDGRTIGALTLERTAGEPFDAETVELCKTTGALLGPIFSLKRENDRGTFTRLREAAWELPSAIFGARHPGAKLIALLLAAVVVFFSLATGVYRVSARTVVEGAIQRAAVSPFDGHIAQSFVRAGDIVRQGQVLCRLDDRDLKLDYERLTAEREQTLRKQRQALAAQDRSALVIAAAQLEETDAQLSLVKDKIARALLVAPFDGVVVSGDLSQLLGTPVERGKLLFEVAPLDAYRVVLEVDERDIASVDLAQEGDLTLSGLPDQRLGFSVQQITPVASQREGRNFFRVEAHLQTQSDRIRPGMEGVGKITIGERKLIWIWTHPLVDWLRAWAWKQLP